MKPIAREWQLTVSNQVIDAQQVFFDAREQEFITKTKQGDRQAFNQLYQAYVKRIYALCWRMLADKDTAEDVTQEVFVQVWQKIELFRGDSKFSTWLHSVATNTVLSHLRKQKNWLQRVFSIESEHGNVAEPQGDEQASEALSKLNELDRQIMRLPERARIVFVLFAIEGYRHEEISTLTGMAVGSSKSQYSRAKELLREWLSDE
jgi:RNA polymerase sigma-70 factor (ECF subfamily)